MNPALRTLEGFELPFLWLWLTACYSSKVACIKRLNQKPTCSLAFSSGNRQYRHWICFVILTRMRQWATCNVVPYVHRMQRRGCFKGGRTSVEGDMWSGRPSTSVIPEIVEEVRQLVKEDCWRTIHNIADIVGTLRGPRPRSGILFSSSLLLSDYQHQERYMKSDTNKCPLTMYKIPGTHTIE